MKTAQLKRLRHGAQTPARAALLAACALALGFTHHAKAQSSAAPARSEANANTSQPDPAQAWADLQAKAALNGLVEASVSYQGRQVQVLVQSKRRFVRAAEQARAIRAAQLIQRDVAQFCGTHCQALPMPEPLLLADGQLRFVLRFQGLGRQLFQEELQALLSGSTGLPAAAPSPAAKPNRLQGKSLGV